MTFLLDVGANPLGTGTVSQEEGPRVFQTMWQEQVWLELGHQTGLAWALRPSKHGGTPVPASSAPETVKLIKAVEPQD